MTQPESSLSPELSVVVPVFNEAESLKALNRELRRVLLESQRAAEIIYVDDGSRDGSREVLQELLREANPGPAEQLKIRAIYLRRNYGQTAALSAGFHLALGKVVFPLDGDGQNNPTDIPRLLAKLEQGYDVVSGWRRARKDAAFSRRLPSMVANRLISWVSGLRLHDYGCTLKAYRADLLKEVHLYGDMHRFIPVYLSRNGARVAELEVDHRPRKAGVSKYGGSRIHRVLLDLVLIRFMSSYYSRPMHFFGQIALVFACAAVLIGALMLAFKYSWMRVLGLDYQASFIQTPLPSLAATFLLGAISSLFFGILGEILIRIHFESRGAVPYAIDSISESGAGSD